MDHKIIWNEENEACIIGKDFNENEAIDFLKSNLSLKDLGIYEGLEPSDVKVNKLFLKKKNDEEYETVNENDTDAIISTYVYPRYWKLGHL